MLNHKLVSQFSFIRRPDFHQPRSPVRPTVLPPDVATAIPVRTLANAACVLQPQGSMDPGRTLTLYSDQEGTIRFHVRLAAFELRG